MVRVLILVGRVGVLDFDTLDVHGVILRRWNWSYSACPVPGSFWHIRIPSVPEAETDFHRGLREVVSRICCGKGANSGTVDRPSQRARGPVYPVGVKLRLWACGRYILSHAVVENPFSKVVCLESVGERPSAFPIDLVEVIREQNHAAYDTLTLCSLRNNFDTTEEKLEIGMHGRGIVSLTKGELGSIGTIIDIFIVGKSPFAWL